MAEGGGLLNRYRVLKPYRGFESHPLRQPFSISNNSTQYQGLREERFVSHAQVCARPCRPAPRGIAGGDGEGGSGASPGAIRRADRKGAGR